MKPPTIDEYDRIVTALLHAMWREKTINAQKFKDFDHYRKHIVEGHLAAIRKL